VRPDPDFLFDDEIGGFACVSPDGTPIGRAEAFERHGPTCLLRIERNGARHLVPFSRPIVREISRERREIVLDPPEGIFEL
jgi:16S rRNA processing protein RimM